MYLNLNLCERRSEENVQCEWHFCELLNFHSFQSICVKLFVFVKKQRQKEIYNVQSSFQWTETYRNEDEKDVSPCTTAYIFNNGLDNNWNMLFYASSWKVAI